MGRKLIFRGASDPTSSGIDVFGLKYIMREKRNAYKILVRKPERKRPLERGRHRWNDNIKTDLRGIGWGGMDWIHLVQDRNK
jgi:hypothetical protein